MSKNSFFHHLTSKDKRPKSKVFFDNRLSKTTSPRDKETTSFLTLSQDPELQNYGTAPSDKSRRSNGYHPRLLFVMQAQTGYRPSCGLVDL